MTFPEIIYPSQGTFCPGFNNITSPVAIISEVISRSTPDLLTVYFVFDASEHNFSNAREEEYSEIVDTSVAIAIAAPIPIVSGRLMLPRLTIALIIRAPIKIRMIGSLKFFIN